MVASNEFRSLLDRLESVASAGTHVSLEELCGDNPGLIEQLRKHLSSQEFFLHFGESGQLKIPDQIGPYRILSVIARGANSLVYLAEQQFPRRKVALKLLHDVSALPRRESRFRLEVELLGTLQHQNIARIFDAGVAEIFGAPRLYFAMEWIDGANVLQFVESKRSSEDWSHQDTIKLCLKYCDALSEAHSEGVVHRDLKPANLLVTSDGVPKLIDFGLATANADRSADPTQESTTVTWVGTRCFMSPEQFGDHQSRIDSRTDIYGFAVVLYRLLAGRLPYPIKHCSMWETAQIVKNEAPIPIGRVDRKLGGDIEVILETALAKDPSERYASINDFANDLRLFIEGRPILARRQSAATALWKWCRRHKTVAFFSSLAVALLVIFSTVATIAATLAVERAIKLSDANQTLMVKDNELTRSNQNYAESTRRLRRTAFNQTLLRLGTLVDREPLRVAQQLDDCEVCPPDLRGYAWRVLRQSTERKSDNWLADRRGLLDLAISDDGTWIVTSGPSGIRVWDVSSQREIAAYSDPVDSRVRPSLTSDPKTVLFACRDGNPVKLDVDSNQSQLLSVAGISRTAAVAHAPDSDGYLVASESGTVTHFPQSGRDELWERKLGESPIVGLTVSKDGERFGAVSKNGDLSVCDVSTGELMLLRRKVVPAPGNRKLTRGRFSSDLRWASLCFDNNVSIVWDMEADQLAHRWNSRGLAPDLNFLTPDSDRSTGTFVTSGRGRVDLWTKDGHLTSLFESDYFEPLTSDSVRNSTTAEIRFDPVAIDTSRNGKTIAIGLRGGLVVVGPIESRKPYKVLPGFRPSVSKLQFAPGGTLLAIVSGAGRMGVYDSRKGICLHEWESGSKLIREMAFADSELFLVTHASGRDVFLWDTAKAQRIQSPPVPGGTRGFAIIGNRLLAGFANDKPVWVPLVTSERSLQFGPTDLKVDSALSISTFDSKSGLIATADQSDLVTLWRISEDDSFEILVRRQFEDLKTMKFFPGGKTLVTGTRSGLITVWSTPTFDEILHRQPNVSQLGQLDISADGAVMASGHFDGEVLFWDTDLWAPQLSVQTNLHPIRALQFSPSGDRLAVGGKGSGPLIFDAPARSDVDQN